MMFSRRSTQVRLLDVETAVPYTERLRCGSSQHTFREPETSQHLAPPCASELGPSANHQHCNARLRAAESEGSAPLGGAHASLTGRIVPPQPSPP